MGTPTTPGSYAATARVTDLRGDTATTTVHLVIAAQMASPSASTPNGLVGSAYDGNLSVAGGSAPYTWSIVAGSLPPGLSLGSDGHIGGTPTQDGVFTTTAQVTDASGATALHTLRVLVLPSVSPFSDVSSDSSEIAYVDAAVAAGLVSGYPDGTFRPDSFVTRAEFTKMLVLAMGRSPGGQVTPFKDLAPDAWYTRYIEAAYHAGIVEGVTAERFLPNAQLTREQAAIMLARAFRLNGTVSLDFTDVSQIHRSALKAVEEVVVAGLMGAESGNAFDPRNPMTRSEAAKVLILALHLAP